MKRNVLPTVLPLLFLAGAAWAVDLPANPVAATPGMERGAWSLEGWGNSGAVEKVSFNGRKILKLIYSSDGKDKTSFKHQTHIGLDKAGKIHLHVFAPEPIFGQDGAPKFAIAVSTTKAFHWHESREQTLKKGWNTFEFSAGATDWKTEASKWQHTVGIQPLDDVRAISLLIFNGARQGVLYVDGITYDPDETGRKVAALIKDLRSEEIEARATAERKLVAIGRPATEALYQAANDERPEVLLRAASALRQIEAMPEDVPADPAVRVEVEKQREEQQFEETRRRADYVLHGLDEQRERLFTLAQEAQGEMAAGRAGLEALKYVDVEKRKAYLEVLAQIDGALRDIQPLVDRVLQDKKSEAAKKAEEMKAALKEFDRKRASAPKAEKIKKAEKAEEKEKAGKLEKSEKPSSPAPAASAGSKEKTMSAPASTPSVQLKDLKPVPAPADQAMEGGKAMEHASDAP